MGYWNRSNRDPRIEEIMDDYDESLDVTNRRVEIDLRCQLMNRTDEMKIRRYLVKIVESHWM